MCERPGLAGDAPICPVLGGEGAGSLVRNLWFEADAASARSTDELDAALGKPSLFWGPLHGSDRALVAALPDLARDVFGLSVTPPPLAAAAAALPAAAEIFQFGVMGSRAGTLTRLCVRGMTEAETVAWLATIGWPGDPAAAIAWVAPYVAAAHSFALNVDLLDGQTGPKLGIELYREPGDIDPALWRGLFAMLQADGLALEAKSEAILRYPGTERFNQSAVWRERKGWGLSPAQPVDPPPEGGGDTRRPGGSQGLSRRLSSGHGLRGGVPHVGRQRQGRLAGTMTPSRPAAVRSSRVPVLPPGPRGGRGGRG